MLKDGILGSYLAIDYKMHKSAVLSTLNEGFSFMRHMNCKIRIFFTNFVLNLL